MAQDTFSIEVLPDGSFKIETDKISAPNHAGAAQFLQDVAKIAGGPVNITRKAGKFTHGQINQQQKATS